MKDSEMLAEIEAREKLRNKGYTWIPCETCKKHPQYRDGFCPTCRGKGGRWQAPMMR